jgi:WD40 repeat protein
VAFTLPQTIAAAVEQFSGRRWMLPTVINWWEKEPDHRLLLIIGGPGTGKSTILAWLSGRGPPALPMERDLRWVRGAVKAAYFCQASSRNTNPQSFATAIADQLSSNVHGFSDVLTKIAAEHAVNIKGTVNATTITGGVATGVAINQLTLAGLGDELSFDRYFSHPIKQLYATGYSEPILLLVDSLDEAQTYGGVTIPTLLSRIDDLPPLVRVIATTRNDPRIVKLYKSAKIFDLDAQEDSNRHDIEAYAIQRLSTTEIPSEERNKFTALLSQRSAGVFLYASLVIDDLLEKAVKRVPTTADYSFPKGLTGLYHDFLSRELGNNERLWFDKYERLLGLIAVAQGEGLTTRQLSDFIGSDIRAELRTCKQYLAGSLPDGPFRLFHQSFADFLLHSDENHDYHIVAARMHEIIISYYQTVLSFNINEAGELPVKLIQERLVPTERSYFFMYLTEHVVGAGLRSAVSKLILDYGWLNSKLAETSIDSIYADFRLAENSKSEWLLYRTLILCNSVLVDDPRQLGGQLLARLSSKDTPELATLLSQASDRLERPCLHPLQPTLIPPGTQVRRIDNVSCSYGLLASPDGQLIASNGGQSLCVLDIESGRQLWKYRILGASGRVDSLVFTPDGSQLVLAWSDLGSSNLAICDTRTGKESKTFPLKESTVALAILPDGRRILSGHRGFFGPSSIDLHNLDDGTLIRSSGVEKELIALSVSSTGMQALAAFTSGLIRVFDVETGEELHRFESNENSLWSELKAATWIPGRDRAVIYSRGCLWILDMASGSETVRFEQSNWDSGVGAVDVSKDGQWVLFAARDNGYQVNVYNVNTGKLCRSLGPHELAVCAVSALASTHAIVSGSLSGSIRIWDLPVYSVFRKKVEAKIYDFTIVPGGLTVLGATRVNRVNWLVELECKSLNETQRSALATASSLELIAITPDGKRILTVQRSTRLKLYNFGSNTEFSDFNNGYDPISAVAITPNGRLAITSHHRVSRPESRRLDRYRDLDRFPLDNGEPEQTVVLKLWDMDSGHEVRRFTSSEVSGGSALAFTLDAERVFSGHYERVELRNLRTWSVEQSFIGPPVKFVYSIAVTSLGLVLVGYDNGQLWGWDLITGEKVCQCDGHWNRITGLAVVNEGRYVVSCSADRSVRVWILPSGQEVARFDFDYGLRRCAVAGEGPYLLVLDDQGQLHTMELLI